jgi:hypothetical protein
MITSAQEFRMRRKHLPMMEESIRKKSENSAKCAGKSAVPLHEIIISPLASKVNNSSYLADFAAHRDCSAVKAVPAARPWHKESKLETGSSSWSGG